MISPYNYKELIPETIKDDSRVWVMQSSRSLTPAEENSISREIKDFADGWKSHGDPVSHYTHIFWHQFIVMAAENTGGCSIDALFRFIKTIDQKYALSLLDRKLQAFFVKDKIQIIPFSQFKHAFQANIVNDDTLYFDNSISTIKELKSKWIIPVRESWLLASVV